MNIVESTLTMRILLAHVTIDTVYGKILFLASPLHLQIFQVLLIVPRAQRAAFMLEPIKHDEKPQQLALKGLLDGSANDAQHEENRTMVREACDIVFENSDRSHYHATTIIRAGMNCSSNI